MKKMKNVVAMLTAAAMLLFLSGSSCLKASAAEPVTYEIVYMADEQDWRYRTDSPEFENPEYYRELYYMFQTLKDGDVVVVHYDGSGASDPVLDLGTIRLSNLTVAQSASFSMIYAGYLDECHVHGGTACSINSDVATAYLYDPTVCNFNKNVGELRLSLENDDDINSTIGCSGTVGRLYVFCPDHTVYDLRGFTNNSLEIADGRLKTPEWQYNQAISQTTPAQPAAPQQTSTPASAPSGEYDAVPKTGNSSPVWLLLCFAALCLAGSLGMKTSFRRFQK